MIEYTIFHIVCAILCMVMGGIYDKRANVRLDREITAKVTWWVTFLAPLFVLPIFLGLVYVSARGEE